MEKTSVLLTLQGVGGSMEAATPREMLVLLLVDLGQTTDCPGSPGHHPNSRNGGREALVEISREGSAASR